MEGLGKLPDNLMIPLLPVVGTMGWRGADKWKEMGTLVSLMGGWHSKEVGFRHICLRAV